MSKKVCEIGQEIEVKEDFKINTIVSDKVITIKEGDKGFLDSCGRLNLTTGKGRGKIVKINDIEMKGYDYENIAKMIYQRLDRVYGLENFITDEEIVLSEFTDEIEAVLSKIL